MTRAWTPNPVISAYRAKRRPLVLAARPPGPAPLARPRARDRASRVARRTRASRPCAPAASNVGELVALLDAIFASRDGRRVGRRLRSRRHVVGAGADDHRGDRRSAGARRRARFVDVPRRRGRHGAHGRHAGRLLRHALGARAARRRSAASTPRRCCSSWATTGRRIGGAEGAGRHPVTGEWAALLLLVARGAAATTFVVAASGGDFTAIQAALDAAMRRRHGARARQGDAVLREARLPAQRRRPARSITLDAWPGEQPGPRRHRRRRRPT